MQWLRNIRLAPRLALLTAVFSAGAVLSGLWTFRTLDEFKVTGPVYSRIVQNKDLLADVLPPPAYIIESYLAARELLAAADPDGRERQVARLKRLRAEYLERSVHWRQAGLDADIAELLLARSAEPAQAFYRRAFDEFIPAVQRGERDDAALALERMAADFYRHAGAVDRLVALTGARADAFEAAAVAKVRLAAWTLLAVLVAAAAAGVALAVVIGRSITAPLADAVAVAQTVAGGDLRARFDHAGHADEPGQLLAALGAMSDSLALTVGQVRGNAEAMSMAARQIAAGNLDLSARTETQAGSLQETASAMEQLTGTVRQNADNAQHANTLALATAQLAGRGGELMTEVVRTMDGIKSASGRIADIIAVIDGIAFQTNILALNAAVEAARAGEQGRGFAVVAAEVRSLAQRSAGAAREVKQLIGHAVGSVDEGGQLVDRAGATMAQVVASVRQVTELMAQIAGASREQSRGIEEVNRAIAQMDQVTQQNAALVEQAAAAAGSMSDQADALLGQVGRFRLAGAAPRPAAEGPLALTGY